MANVVERERREGEGKVENDKIHIIYTVSLVGSMLTCKSAIHYLGWMKASCTTRGVSFIS